MKKTLSALALVFALAAPAAADDKLWGQPYVSGGVAYSATENGPNQGNLNLSYGHDFGFFRGELTYDALLGKGLDNHMLSLNGYLEYDVPDTKLTPFVGAGVGYMGGYGDRVGHDDDGVALIGSAGLRYAINDHLGVEGSYRYITSEVDVQHGRSSSDYEAHVFGARMTYRW